MSGISEPNWRSYIEKEEWFNENQHISRFNVVYVRYKHGMVYIGRTRDLLNRYCISDLRTVFLTLPVEYFVEDLEIVEKWMIKLAYSQIQISNKINWSTKKSTV